MRNGIRNLYFSKLKLDPHFFHLVFRTTHYQVSLELYFYQKIILFELNYLWEMGSLTILQEDMFTDYTWQKKSIQGIYPPGRYNLPSPPPLSLSILNR